MPHVFLIVSIRNSDEIPRKFLRQFSMPTSHTGSSSASTTPGGTRRYSEADIEAAAAGMLLDYGYTVNLPTRFLVLDADPLEECIAQVTIA
jgi:hypothetical protein